jgi:TP901 family phage tail tape measure protein
MGFLSGSSGSLGSVGGATARLVVLITGTSAPLQAELAKASSALGNFGSKAGALGSVMTRSLTVPLLGLGVVSVAMASQWEAMLAKLSTLTPVLETSGKSIEGVSADLFAMSSQTATSVTTLANTLYFAGSAGLNYADAMEVTRLASQGAAVGMGEAEDIARTLVAAMNNWGPETLSAAQAMDALTIAIREGLAEPAEFAIALGRVMPIAQQAGLSFNQLTASIAQLTNLGMPTRVATTSLRALITGMIGPTIKTETEFAKYGLTLDQVANAMEAGPLVAFELMSNAVDKSGMSYAESNAALRNMMPTIRGYTAYLALTGQAQEKFAEIQRKSANAEGAFAKVWEEFQQTPAIKWKQMLADLQGAGIKLGQQLLPVFMSLMRGVSGLANSFTQLGPAGQKVAAGLLLIGASAGPALTLFSNLTNAGAGLYTSLKSTTIGLITMGTAAVFAVSGLSQMMSGSLGLGPIIMASLGSFIALKLAIAGVSAVMTPFAVASATAATAYVTAAQAEVVAAGEVAAAEALLNSTRTASGRFTAESSIAIGLRAEALQAEAIAANEAAAANARYLSATRGARGLGSVLGGLTPGMITGIGIAFTLAAVGVAYFIGKSKEARKSLDNMGSSIVSAARSGSTFQAFIETMTDPALAAALTADAKAAGTLNTALSAGIPATYASQVQVLSRGLGELANMKGAGSDWLPADQVATLEKASDVMAHVAIEGGDMGQHLADAGIPIADFNSLMKEIGSSGTTEMQDQANGMLDLSLRAGELYVANKKYQLSVADSITLNEGLTQAVQDTADTYGVTTEQVNSALSSMGLTSADLVVASQRDAIAVSAEWVDASGEIVGAQREIEAAFTATQAGLLEQIGLFGKLDTKVQGSNATLIKQAEAHATFASKTVLAAKELVAKGVPTELVNKIMADSPAMAQQLADASIGELKRLTNAYKVELAATDAEILKEGKHQFVKGQDMVVQLTQGILSNDSLSPKAAQHLITQFQGGLASGKITEEGMFIAQKLIEGIQDTPELAGSADRLISKIFRDMASGVDFAGMGDKAFAKYIQGITGNKGDISKTINDTVSGAISRSGGISPKFAGVGADIGSSLASQIAAGVQSDKISQVGVDVMNQIISGIKSANLPPDISTGITNQIMSDVATGKVDLSTMGTKAMATYVQGLAQSKGAAAGAVRSVVAAAAAAARGGASLTSAGAALGQSLAQGIASSTGAVTAAVNKLIAAAKAAAENAALNSPEYFTYYMGKRVAADLGRGMDEGFGKLHQIRVPIGGVDQMKALSRLSEASGNGGQGMQGNITITNWQTGMAMFDGRIESNANKRDRHQARLERMNS